MPRKKRDKEDDFRARSQRDEDAEDLTRRLEYGQQLGGNYDPDRHHRARDELRRYLGRDASFNLDEDDL